MREGPCRGRQPSMRHISRTVVALFTTATLAPHSAAIGVVRHGQQHGLSAFVPASMMPAQRHPNAVSKAPLDGLHPRLWASVPRARGIPSLAVPGRTGGSVRMALRDQSGPGHDEQMKRMIKNFLMQRAVQTYLYTLELAGQRSEFEFIEGYQGHQGLSRVNNYGALRLGWQDYISNMMRLPEQTTTKKFEFYRGGSKGNPYIQPNVREVTQTVSPRALSATILELRGVLSSEWSQDLQLIAQENAEHWRHHLAVLTNGTDPEAALQHRLIDPHETDSPLRLANYELLEKFCTHIACTQVVTEMAQSPADEYQAMWFKTYMETKNSLTHSGAEGGGRVFIQNLLNEPPRVVSLTSDAGATDMKLIDPLDIAARIMAQRQVVAERWMEALADTEEDHLNVFRQFIADCLDKLETVRSDLEKLL